MQTLSHHGQIRKVDSDERSETAAVLLLLEELLY